MVTGMPRRSSKLPMPEGEDSGEEIEGFDVGRHIAALERAGYKELVDELRVRAKTEGKTLSDKMAETLKAGLAYDKYSKLTLADAMLVMDWLERAFANFIFPVMQTVGLFQVQSNIDQVRAIAQGLGYIPRDQAEKIATEKARQILAQVQAEQESQKEKGPISLFVETLSQILAERVSDAAIQQLIASGKLDEFLNSIGDLAVKALGKTLAQEGGGGAGGGEAPPG